MGRFLPLLSVALALSLGRAWQPQSWPTSPSSKTTSTPGSAWEIYDHTVSTAVYATLESSTDVGYFTFEVEAGQSVLLQMTIPEIEGQEEFVPTMALLGSGLPANELSPQRKEVPSQVPARGDIVGSCCGEAARGPIPGAVLASRAARSNRFQWLPRFAPRMLCSPRCTADTKLYESARGPVTVRYGVSVRY